VFAHTALGVERRNDVALATSESCPVVLSELANLETIRTTLT